MQTPEIVVGLVPLARTTFDMALAEQVTAQVRARLEAQGFVLRGPAGLITNMEETHAAAAALAADPPDLLLVFQATFADSTMVLELAQAVDAPLLMWAIPEGPTGGRLRLNSLCGINLGAHSLKRAGIHYTTVYAAPEDESALEKVRTWGLAGRARRLLRGARIGRVGENPAGFEPCTLDKAALQTRFGVEVVQLTLAEIFAAVQATPPEDVDAVFAGLRDRLDRLDEMDATALRCSLATYLTLQRFAGEQQLNGLAVRCWPEFFTDLGCAACGAMSLLSNELTPCSCEADINGTVTQLLLQWISGTPTFGTDMVSFDLEQDQAIVWHCGLAPLAMADPDFRPRATIHSNRKLPLLMEFPLKPGPVTIARLTEAAGTGRYQLVVGSGEMLRAPLSFSGTSGVLRFERPAAQVLETILSEGLDHHISLTYGAYAPTLLALAELLELPVLRL